MRAIQRFQLVEPAVCLGSGVLVLLFLVAPAVAKADVEHGKTVFAKSCAPCHGSEGQGKVAPALVPFEMQSQELLRIVRDGVEEMGGMSEKQVSDEDVEAVGAYLKDLTERASKS